MGAIGPPWWNIGGNHDLIPKRQTRKYSRETFKRVFGPNHYAFFYGQTLFLMSTMSTISDSTRKLGEGGSTKAGSTRANSSLCATCSRIRRMTR